MQYFFLLCYCYYLYLIWKNKKLPKCFYFFFILTAGVFVVLYIILLLALFYFTCISIPLSISAIILTILQKKYLAKGKMNIYLVINFLTIILVIIIINNKNTIKLVNILIQFISGVIQMINIFIK